jgi:hypothetical protein
MTPQQDSLSGVIICPAKSADEQRLRVNSFTTIWLCFTTRSFGCQIGDATTCAIPFLWVSEKRGVGGPNGDPCIACKDNGQGVHTC